MRLAFAPLCISLSLALIGSCGGGGGGGPGPLHYTLDEGHIAKVPPDQRPQVTQAQNDFNMAKSEKLSAQAAFEQADTDYKLAKNELDSAMIAEKSAKVKADSAKSSGDQTAVNSAEHESRAALLGRRAADAKVSYAKAKKAWAKKWLRYTEYDSYAKEAKYELEKAKVAKANNISPKGFAFEPFDKQYKERSEASQRAKAEADKEKSKMSEKEKDWKGREKEWNEFRGQPTGDGLKGAPTGPDAPPQPPPQ